MPRVEIPNVGTVEFPDTMSEEEINKAAKRLYEGTTKKPTAKPKDTRSIYEQMKEHYAQKPKSARQLAEEAPMTLGAAGAAVAGPPGALLGGITGKAINIAGRSFAGEESRYSGFGGALRGLKEEATSGAIQYGLDLGLGLVAKLVGKGISSYAARYARPSQVAAREGFKEAGEEATSLKKVGPKITEQDITTHNVTNALQKSFNEFGPRKELSEAGVAVKDALEAGEENFHSIYKKEYEALNQVARDKIPEGKGFVDSLTVRKRFKALTPEIETKAARAAPKSLGYHEYAAQIRDDIENLQSVDFDVAQKMRSEWLTKARESGSAEAVKFAKRAGRAMDWGMEEAAKSISPEFYQTWRALNESYKKGITKFESTYVEGLMKRSPEDLVKSLKPEQATKAITIRDALLEYGGEQGKQAWATFQRSYAEQLFRKPEVLKRSLEAAGENLDVVFNNAQGQALLGRMRRMGEAIEVAREIDPRLINNLHEGFRVGGLGYLGMRLANAADQAGAYMYVKIAESPAATKLFVDGLAKAPQDYAGALANMSRVLYLVTSSKTKKSEYLTPAERAAQSEQSTIAP